MTEPPSQLTSYPIYNWQSGADGETEMFFEADLTEPAASVATTSSVPPELNEV
jgi:hypothetical protein